MAEVFLQPYYIFGRKVSVGAFDQGYFGNAAVPTASLDVFGSVRFRGNVVLTDSRLNFGAGSSRTGGNGAVVFGSFNQAMGYNSMSQGTNNAVYSNNSIAVGQGLVSSVGDNQALFGQYNAGQQGNVLMVVGDGQDSGNRGDALRVSKSGMVYANALTVGTGVRSASYGPLIEANVAGSAQGVKIDANATYLYGPSVQLAALSNGSVAQHMTISNGGAEFDSDCVFKGNVTIVGQTFSTVTQKYTTVSTVIEASDPIITVGHGYAAQNGNGTFDIGLIGERGTSNTGVIWDESRGEWAFIDTYQSSEIQQFSQFSYANLHVNNVTAAQITSQGSTQNGNLSVQGSITANAVVVSNGPLVVANVGLCPSQPDTCPIGQANNRFSRAFVDTLDVYDSQDAYPAKIGASGEANVYLYTTSPAYSDTVGIYFDKGNPGRSSIVQGHDQWSLRTQGVDRLTAQCVSGNLRVANEMVLCDNVTCYGSQVRLINSVFSPGLVQGNTAVWSNTTIYGGNMLPAQSDTVSLGVPGQRFANACLNTADLFQDAPTSGPTLKVGSVGNTSLYMYSGSNNCQIAFDNGGNNKSSILQNQSSFILAGASGQVLVANTATNNLTFCGDQSTLGNSTVQGMLSVSNDVVVLGSLNLGAALLSNGVPLAATMFKATGNAFVSNAADPGFLSTNTAISFPSSIRIGDSTAPTGVLEVVQANTCVKFGGLNGCASDLTTTSNVMGFNIAGASASAWTFNRVANYGNLATKMAVATIDSTGSYIQSSDARYKQDVKSIGDDATSKLLKLKPRSYKVHGSTRQKYGLIAQEVLQVFPELVHENEAGFLSVDYTALIPLMLSKMMT